MPIPTPLFLTRQNLAFTHDAATVPARLTAHARTMAQGVYQVAEDFYVAVGYGHLQHDDGGRDRWGSFSSTAWRRRRPRDRRWATCGR